MQKHYVCQTRHGNWMIGIELPEPHDPSIKTVCRPMTIDEPFNSITSPSGTYMFYTAKALWTKLAERGYTKGPRRSYHCWEIVKA